MNNFQQYMNAPTIIAFAFSALIYYLCCKRAYERPWKKFSNAINNHEKIKIENDWYSIEERKEENK